MYRLLKEMNVERFERKVNKAVNDEGFSLMHFTAVESEGTVWLIALLYQMEY